LAMLLERPDGGGAWETGTDITVIAEAGDEDVVGSRRDTLKAPSHVALVRVPLDGRKPAARALVKLRTGGMGYTERVAVPAPPSLGGDPLQSRNGAWTVLLSCSRRDATRLEWPVLADVEATAARLFDRTGRSMPIPVALARRERRLIGDVSLAPLTRGDYLVE